MSEKKSKGWSLFFILPKIGNIFKGITVLAKGAKLLGPLLTVLSMTASIWAYSYAMGWKLALMFVVLLFAHEMGHVIGCWRKGIDSSAPLFIPFIGALIFAPSNMSREEESYMGFGGPLLGTIASLFVWLLWWLIPSHPPVLLMGSFISFFLNLFNLLPISPFDGGRILQSVGDWIKWFGLSVLFLLTIAMNDPTMLYIWVIVMVDFRFKYRAPIMILTTIIMTIGFLVEWGGSRHWLAPLIYILLSSLLCVMAYHRDKDYVEEVVRPAQPRSRGMFWLFSYLLLASVIIASMSLQSKDVLVVQEQIKQEQKGTP